MKTPFRSRNMEPLTPTECEALVAQLAEPTTRRSARRKLVAAEAKHFEALLRKNLTLRAGAFAIRDIDGHAHFVMIDTLSATATAADDLARRIEQIAAQAGAVEGVLAREEQSRHG